MDITLPRDLNPQLQIPSAGIRSCRQACPGGPAPPIPISGRELPLVMGQTQTQRLQLNPAAPVKPSARVQQSYLRCFPSSELQRLPPIFCIGLFCLALLQTTQTFKYSPCPAHSVPSWPRGTAQQTPRGVQEQRGIQRGDFADLFLNLRQIYTELLAAPRCSSSHFPNHAELNLPFLLLRREQF